MNSIFSYDSPLMQVLTYIGDLIILNFIFLLCCLPVFTIGAAQAGMFTAVRVLSDKEDDSSVVAAFFRGFKNGFGKVTLAWGILFLGFLAMCAVGALAYALQLSVWLCIVPLVIIALFMALVPAFHSRFGCTAMQLIRNCWFLLVAHPLRSLGVAILLWAPLALLAYDVYMCMMATPVWCTLYFSTAFLFSEMFMRKPFKTLVQEFHDRQAAEGKEEPEELPDPSKKVFSDTPTADYYENE